MKPAKPQHPLIRDGKRGMVPSRFDGRLDVEYNTFLDTLDPEKRGEIRLALALTPDPRFKAFLGKLGSKTPRGHRISYAAMAKASGIGLEEFHDWFNKAQTQRVLALCMVNSVDLVEEMIKAAKNRMVGCDRCDGLGWVEAEEGLPMDTPGYKIRRIVTVKLKDEEGNVTGEEDRPIYQRDCPAGCDKGKVMKVGDDFRLEKVLEIAGHINKKGPGLQLNQFFGGAAMGPASQQLSSAMTIDVEANEAET